MKFRDNHLKKFWSFGMTPPYDSVHMTNASFTCISYSAVTLLVKWHEGHLARRNTYRTWQRFSTGIGGRRKPKGSDQPTSVLSDEEKMPKFCSLVLPTQSYTAAISQWNLAKTGSTLRTASQKEQHSLRHTYNYLDKKNYHMVACSFRQCFDAVGWAAGRASGL